MEKTNAMRLLDSAKIEYKTIEYTYDENDLAGTHIAKQTGLPMEMVFKTLVAKGDKTGIIVFCLPVDKEVDTKKAAVVSGNKKIEFLHVKDLLSATGYIRGGCSPVGMKKKYKTFFEESCLTQEEITVSAGVRGCQLKVNREKLVKFLGAEVFPFVR